MINFILIGIIGILAFFSVRYLKRNPYCKNCSGCKNCHLCEKVKHTPSSAKEKK